MPREVVSALLELAMGVAPAAVDKKARKGAGRKAGSSEDEGSDAEEEEEENENEEAAADKKGGRRGKQQQQQLHGGKAAGSAPAAAAAAKIAAAAAVSKDTQASAQQLCLMLSKLTGPSSQPTGGGLFAGQAALLRRMLESDDSNLQTLGAQLLARWARIAAGLSPNGAVVGAIASPAGKAAASAQPHSPRSSRAAAGEQAAAAATAQAAAEESAAIEVLRAPLLAVASNGAPKAAKHAVMALHLLFGSTCAQVRGCCVLRSALADR